MKVILYSLNVDSKNVKIKTAQCLIDFSKLHYTKLKEYILSFVENLGPVMMNGDEEIASPAIEVFNTIAIEDRDRDSTKQFSNVKIDFFKVNDLIIIITKVQQVNASLRLTADIYDKIIPILLQNLLRQPNEADDGELSLHDTATKCLSTIIEVIGDDALELLKGYISRNLFFILAKFL